MYERAGCRLAIVEACTANADQAVEEISRLAACRPLGA
jgi:hypothetical protein